MRILTILCLLGLGVIFMPRPTLSVTMSIVSVTAYSSNCFRQPHYGKTSSGKRVKEGMVALSRDVERSLRLKFGNRVLLHGLGVFQFEDRMASRWRKKADVFMKSVPNARRFGLKRHVVLVKLA